MPRMLMMFVLAVLCAACRQADTDLPPASGTDDKAVPVHITPAIAILIGVFLPFTIYVSPQTLDTARSIKVGDTIPHFTAVDGRGETFDSASLHGHLVLIKFFRAHW